MRNPYSFREEGTFQKDSFQDPHISFAPVYGWVWNAPVSKEETDKQLAEMVRLGIKAMYVIPEPKMFRPTAMYTMMEPDYLTEPFFEAFSYAVEQAKKLGMSLWLYNEGGWPSGGACGKVVYKHPELARKTLAKRERTYKAGETLRHDEDTLATFDGQFVQLSEGYVFEKDTAVTEYIVHTCFFENPGIPDFPDLMLKESTEAFLQETHEGYKKYLQSYFGETILAVFTDEPTAPRPLPYRDLIQKAFENTYGYSLIPYLPELMEDKAVTQQGAKARIDYFDLCSKIFCENYMLTEKKWCNDNNMAYTGHIDLDHTAMGCVSAGNFHVLRALRCFDVPGIDVIWRQIFPSEQPKLVPDAPFPVVEGENNIFPRYASSAASQIGTQRAMTETFGVYGMGLTFDEMRYILNYQAIRGVNTFNFLLIPYARTGHLLTGELPYFIEDAGCYADLKPFNSYSERLSYITALGKNTNEVALYMPMQDFWAGKEAVRYNDAFEATGKQLEAMRVSFDVADDDVFALADEKEVRNGKIRLNDACYRTIVIPPAEYIPESTIATLEAFIAGGGKVLMVKDKNTPAISGAVMVDTVAGMLPATVAVECDSQKLIVMERKLENGKLQLLHNEELKPVTLKMQADANTYLLDLYSGEIQKPNVQNGKMEATLLSGQMLCVLTTDTALDARECLATKQKFALNGEFAFKKTKQMTVGDMKMVTTEFSEDYQKISLGDWSEVVGAGFTGSGIYKTEFSALDIDKPVILDLGVVKHTCEVFLNGVSLGVRVMAPYSYEIPGKLLAKNNTLEIRVTNTAANAYMDTKTFDKWKSWQIPFYWQMEKKFQVESLESGLFGPVQLFY